MYIKTTVVLSQINSKMMSEYNDLYYSHNRLCLLLKINKYINECMRKTINGLVHTHITAFNIIPNPYDFLFLTWNTKINELTSLFHRESKCELGLSIFKITKKHCNIS